MVSRRRFGVLPDGAVVDLLSISRGRLELSALTYGGIITSLRVPDRHGQQRSVVLGFDRLEPYLADRAYLGAIVGRYANRIAGGRFRVDGVSYRLATNDGHHHLHGGLQGFGRQLWDAAPVEATHAVGVAFTRTSPAGEDGYPGALRVEVRYDLMDDDTVVIRYTATTDATTIVNLTQHSYFNLSDEPLTVLDHELCIHAEHYTPVGTGLIPDGTVAAVAGTPFDFRRPVRIADRARQPHPQLLAAGGFDHNYVLAPANRPLTLAATLREPRSGRTLEVSTTEPGLQFYGGHLLDDICGPGGFALGPHAGLCLETQHFPDSPNRTQFPPVVLREDEQYSSTTSWRFGLDCA